MLENMFVGRPPGNYDRLLDVSRAVTGILFFVPSATFLEDAPNAAPASPVEPAATRAPEAAAPASSPPPSDGYLGIGSLKGEAGHE